jgi:hypothetical protein
LLDTNVFVQAHRSYYAFDICPGFWETLLEQHDGGRLHSLDRVLDELSKGNDALKKWARDTVPPPCFAKTNEARVVRAFGEAQRWVDAQPRFVAAAKAEFAQVADGWLAAYAREHRMVVVTLELPNAYSQRRVPLPDVCQAVKVEFISPFMMLRELKVAFTCPMP